MKKFDIITEGGTGVLERGSTLELVRRTLVAFVGARRSVTSSDTGSTVASHDAR
jgi:hypothetical protein